MAYEQLLLLGAPILRGVAGWLENALADAKISAFEWKELVKTVLKLGIPAAALYYGLSLPIEVAASVPVIVDYVYQYFKKLAQIKPTVTA